MKKNLSKYLLSVFIFLLCIPLFSNNLIKIATEIYDSTKQKHNQDTVFVEGEYVFFKVSVICKEEDELERDGEIMIARFNAVRKYICAPFEAERLTVSPFGTTMAKFVTPDFVFSMEDIRVYVVYSDEQSKKSTRVYAFEKKQIDGLQEQIKKQIKQMKGWDSATWASLLANAYKSIRHEEDKEKVRIFLGCPILNTILSGSMYFHGENDQTTKQALDELSAFHNSGSSEFYTAWKSNIWQLLWGTKGNLLFLQHGNEGEQEFLTAVALYNQGKDLPQILSLLKKTIERMPNNAEKWRYLGGSLMVMGKNPEALVAYIQAGKLSPDNKDILSKIAELCEKCSLPVNAEGIKWYIEMMNHMK